VSLTEQGQSVRAGRFVVVPWLRRLRDVVSPQQEADWAAAAEVLVPASRSSRSQGSLVFATQRKDGLVELDCLMPPSPGAEVSALPVLAELASDRVLAGVQVSTLERWLADDRVVDAELVLSAGARRVRLQRDGTTILLVVRRCSVTR